jgi:hypothetical protein
MKYKKILSFLNEINHSSNLYEIKIQNFIKLVDMGLGAKKSLNDFHSFTYYIIHITKTNIVLKM